MTQRSIFRRAALERHAESQDRAVLPPLVGQCTLRALWILLALLLCASWRVAWSVRSYLIDVGDVSQGAR